MTQGTILRAPSDFVVMTLATELAVYDVGHQYLVGTRAHFEADLGVAYPATKPDAMEPVRKDHRAHTGFFRPRVKHHVAIFCQGGKRS
jgi:hypothetical protein